MTLLRFLVGCTASGKKSVARLLGNSMDLELLSLDALKVYRGMNRGTDKAPGRFGLTDLVEPTESFSVGSYVKEACRAVGAAESHGREVLFVGGTGLYLRALVRGLFDGPEVPEEVRNRVQTRLADVGSATLHEELSRVDPDTAGRLHPNDAKRIMRAIEMYEHTGIALSRWQRERTEVPLSGELRLAGVRWPTVELRRRIVARVERMFANGLLDEVRDLHEKGRLGPVASQAIGYREVLDHLSDKLDLARCRREIELHTWHFARRQQNWFRQFPEIQWVDASAGEDTSAIAKRVEGVLKARERE